MDEQSINPNDFCFVFPETVKISEGDTDEIAQTKLTEMYNLWTNMYLTLDSFTVTANEAFFITIMKIMEQQILDNLQKYYDLKDIYFPFDEKIAPSSFLTTILESYNKNFFSLYKNLSENILKEVGDSDFSLNLSIGAAGYLPQILYADNEFIEKIYKKYQYNYIICIDPQDSSFSSEKVVDSYINDNAEFIVKAKTYLKAIFNTNVEPVFERYENMNNRCYSLSIKTPEGNITKIFFLNVYYYDFFFYLIKPVVQKARYSIFNCAKNLNECTDSLLDKNIFDNFTIMSSIFGNAYRYDPEKPIAKFNEYISTWIFYIQKYKESGNTFNDLETTIKDIVVNRKRDIGESANFEGLKTLLSNYFFRGTSENTWNLLGGRRRKSTRRRKQKSKRTRKH